MLTDSIFDEIAYKFRHGGMVWKLLLVNIAVFVVFGLFKLVTYFTGGNDLFSDILLRVCVPASLPTLLKQPWSVFTYMFLHTDVRHILFNMLWLYWFGEVYVSLQGNKRVLPLYITGGLFGALFYIGIFNVAPMFKPMVEWSIMLGASASVFAIVFAAVTLSPNYQFNLLFIGPVKIKYIAAVAIFIDMLEIPNGGGGTFFAHLGGAVSGMLFIVGLRNGVDVLLPFTKAGASLKGFFKPRPKLKVTHKNISGGVTPPVRRTDDEQQRIDEILDRISRSGYDSLTAEEKDFLYRYSKK